MRIGLLLGVVAAAAVSAAAAPTHEQAPPQFHGEYGLWVEDQDSVLHVQWLTRGAAPGYLRVVADGTERVIVTTAAGFRHAVPLKVRGQRRLTIEYGSTADPGDRHSTEVRLDRPSRPRVTWPQPDTLYVFGDTHGEYDHVVAVMRNAGVIDSAGRWTGGRAHIAFLGDLVDRGPDVMRLLWFVYRLEDEAARAGGRVHVLLGNHEIMVAMRDLRYVHPKEAHLAELHGVGYDRLLDMRRSILGRWLASKPVLIRVGEALLVHGGAIPEPRLRTLQAVDDTLARYVSEDLFYHWGNDNAPRITIDSAALERRTQFFAGERSLFWHRGYVQSDTAGTELSLALRRAGAKVQVVGHTPVTSGIETRYGGRLIAANVVPAGSQALLMVRRASGVVDRFRIGREGAAEAVGR